jgi:RNA polymerase sigma-70 factor (ECF subfamily)
MVQNPLTRFLQIRLFDRRWALTVLERALATVQREFSVPGKELLFDALRPALTGERTAASYAEIAERFVITEAAVKVTVHRLRQRYRAALRSEIARTVATSEEVDVELQDLFQALGD